MSSDPMSVRIAKLLGTDDWLILHSGHLMLTAEDLDMLELAAPDRQVEL